MIMYTYETKPAFKPIMVFCFPPLTSEQRAAIASKLEKMVGRMKRSGWIYFILDVFDKMDVRAFGVPESQFGELDELKKLVEQSVRK